MNEADAQIEKLNEKNRAYLKKYFANAPAWLMDALQVVQLQKDVTFIDEGEKADQIYILLKGKVLAVDYRVREMVYGFFEFDPIEAFGTMEILVSMARFKTTLVTMEDSIFLKISRDKFERWLRSDLQAFQMETEKVGRYLLEQARKERLWVLLQGVERVYLVLIKMYEIYAKNDRCVIYMSRKDFVETTGLSERTISRIIKELERKDYIRKDGWNIIITRGQYLGIKALIEDKINGIGE